jgi:hypothetical protein
MKVFKTIALILVVSSSLWAAHISSASISYTCLGNDTYAYELVIFRDCTFGGAQFDNPVRIGVYSGDNFLETLNVPLSFTDDVEDVEFETYPNCEVNSESYCVQKGTYSFELNLPTQLEEYVVFYTRCCFSANVANMLDGDRTGITVVCEISPLAQMECNSQDTPSFNLTRPYCLNTLYESDLPTVDSEGDSLAYSMCLPYRGGGPQGATEPGDANGCSGVTPNPVICPPSYEPIELLPEFSEEDPFPTLDGFTLDNINGTLSFTPTIQGVYHFGLCVEEYRNGALLSSTIINLAKWDERISSSEDIIDDYDLRVSAVSDSYLELVTDIDISQNINVSILDVSGKSIDCNKTINTHSITLDFNSLSSGIYFVKVSGSRINETMKVFIP